MSLTLDGSTVLPALGGYGSGSSMAGLGAGAIGGGLLGLLAGSVLGNRGGNNWGGNYGGGNYGGGLIANAATGAVADSVVLNPAFQSLQNQVTNLSTQVASGDLNGILNSEFRRLNTAVDTVASDIESHISNLSTAQAAGNFTTLQSINGLGRDLTASATQALINSIQNFNQLQNAQQVATNQIIAGQNANAAAMANCCCEIKGLITTDGNLTRALINDNTIQSLRDRNTDLSVQVSNNTQNQYLLHTILTHLTPTAAITAVV